MSTPLAEAKGVDGQLIVYDYKVIITRRGVFGALSHHAEMTIPIGGISSVKLTKTSMPIGFFEVVLKERFGYRAEYNDWSESNNTLAFLPSQLAAFERAQAIIERQMYRSAPLTGTPDVPTLIRELADLKAAGILTEDEFETKKAELLARM